MNKYFFILITILLNVIGGYLAKISALSTTTNIQIQYTIIAIAFYGFGFIFYTIALRYIPLFIAQSLLISQYVFMLLIAVLIFREPLSYTQGLGMMLMLIGLFLIIIIK